MTRIKTNANPGFNDNLETSGNTTVNHTSTSTTTTQQSLQSFPSNKQESNFEVGLLYNGRKPDGEDGGGLETKRDYDSNDSFNLRPKFAIIKHKTEVLRQQTTNQHSNEHTATTPAWFFNIPSTRSPFPDFGSKVDSSPGSENDD